MITTINMLLAIARLLNVKVDDLVNDDAMMDRVSRFLNEINS